jgi:hypothetical protein
MSEPSTDTALADVSLASSSAELDDPSLAGSPRSDASSSGTSDAESNLGANKAKAALSVENVARGLGWFSIALGAWELLRPRGAADATGSQRSSALIKAYGLRELTTGIGLLTARDPEPWLWARVSGDALDLATLVTDLRSPHAKTRNTAIAIAVVLGVTVIDALCAKAAHDQAQAPQEPPRDYSDRVGMALSPEEMRGTARSSLQVAPDMQTPSALRPYALDSSSA